MDSDRPVVGGPTGQGRGEERRTVTTLFCDLVDFTALSERNDPEIVDAFLRRYYAAARRVIEAYGGTVEKFIGDAVVAVFGVPAVHEDDPERAVRAGLRLIDEVDALPGVGDRAVEVRVGVNTGEALVRLHVDPASGEGFLTGDAVNVSARLQTAAPPMAVAVGAATHAATAKVFAFDACHPVALRGKSRPLQAWIATAPLARTGSELRTFSSTFVGREEELAALEHLLDAARNEQAPHFALVVGAPGIGKSRLLAELARRLDDQPALVTWRQGRCLPYGAGVTFWALSEIVRATAGILESDGVARAEARLETVLPDSEDRDRLRDRLRPLLGLGAEEASREDNFAAWREFLEDQAASGPAVLVVEDLHWADEAMRAFMDYLAQGSANVPLFVVVTARPEVLELAGPGGGFVAAAAHVPLGPLSGEETAELARARLGAKSLPTDLQALILERSGGNPLFAEELIRLLEDRGLLDSRGGRVALREGVDVPMPDSIGALIAARLDLLSPERKALLADAAVVGRTFWAGAVAAVGGRAAAEVLEGLMELVAKELVSPVRGSSMEGETEFLFVHALVCDVAYEQLTRAHRAEKHAALARWLEQRTAGRTEDLAEVLAYHYGTALEMASSCGLFELEDELAEPTTRYLALAGGRAAPLDPAAAAAHFARAERVADEAARPKRRFFLSRSARRTLKRRAPLLAVAAAVIIVTLVSALAIWALAPSKTSGAAKTMTPAQIADKYGPSVVRITSKVPTAVGDKLQWRQVAVSGVAVSESGLVFTNGRLFLNRAMPSWSPTFVTVEYVGDQGLYQEATGVFAGADLTGDIGLVRVNLSGARFQPVPLGDSESVKTNDSVVTLSRQGTFLARASGSIGALLVSTLEAPKAEQAVVAMRINATLPMAVTGGALIDSRGQLVGVMGDFHATLQDPGYEGRDMAVSVGLFKQVVPNIQRLRQRDPAAWLGVAGSTIMKPLRGARSTHHGGGVLVEFVTPGSPADKAGIVGGGGVTTLGGEQHVTGGDVLVGLDRAPVHTIEDLQRFLGRMTPGKSVAVHLLRGLSRVTVKAKLVASPWRG